MKIKYFLRRKEKETLLKKQYSKASLDYDFEAEVENIRESKSSIKSGYMAPAFIKNGYFSCKITLFDNEWLLVDKPVLAKMKFLCAEIVNRSFFINKEFYLYVVSQKTVRVKVTKIYNEILDENYKAANDKSIVDSANYEKLFISIRKIINEWDPIGLIEMGSPLNEYDLEVGMLIKDIRNNQIENLAFTVHYIFERCFGPASFKKTYSQCRNVAFKIAKLLGE